MRQALTPLGRAPSIPEEMLEEALDAASREPTALDLVRGSVTVSVLALVRHDPAVRLGRDVDAVHDARVAIRRARSTLRTFRPILDPEATDALRRELAWIADALGGVRDTEVLQARVRSRLEAIDHDAGAGDLLEELEQRRADARRSLLAAMSSTRYATALERLVEAARTLPGLDHRAGWPADRAVWLMARPWKRLAKRADLAEREGTDAALHRARIAAKQVRYAAELFQPVVGKGARGVADGAESVQDALGEHQDAVTTIAWLAQHTGRAGSPDAAFAAGRLAQLEAAARADARAAWPVAWRALRRRKRFWS